MLREITFLHLKRTVRGPCRTLRGQSQDLARQEAWALLLIHNTTVPPPPAPPDPPASTLPHPLHSRPQPHPLPRRRRHLLPTLRPPSRQRTSDRTAAERRTRHTEEVTYTIGITKSNLPNGTQSGNLRAARHTQTQELPIVTRTGNPHKRPNA